MSTQKAEYGGIVDVLFRVGTCERNIRATCFLLRYRGKDIRKRGLLRASFTAKRGNKRTRAAVRKQKWMARDKARRTISSRALGGGSSARRPGPCVALGGVSAHQKEDCSLSLEIWTAAWQLRPALLLSRAHFLPPLSGAHAQLIA
jgi:hypothetical protein